jgi:hypothetical protein
MADYHTTYKNATPQSTEWDDIQRRLGNLPAAEKPAPPAAFAPVAEPARRVAAAAELDGRDAAELEGLEDELEEDRFLENYRAARLAELRAGAGAPAAPRFGSLEPLRGADFLREVSRAPPGVWVVTHLAQDSAPGCGAVDGCLAELAARYPATKFLRAVSTDVIPRYPDAHLPTVLLYKDGRLVATLAGLAALGGRLLGADALALALNAHGDVCGDADAEARGHVRGIADALLKRQLERAGSESEGE